MKLGAIVFCITGNVSSLPLFVGTDCKVLTGAVTCRHNLVDLRELQQGEGRVQVLICRRHALHSLRFALRCDIGLDSKALGGVVPKKTWWVVFGAVFDASLTRTHP